MQRANWRCKLARDRITRSARARSNRDQLLEPDSSSEARLQTEQNSETQNGHHNHVSNVSPNRHHWQHIDQRAKSSQYRSRTHMNRIDSRGRQRRRRRLLNLSLRTIKNEVTIRGDTLAIPERNKQEKNILQSFASFALDDNAGNLRQ